jgi:hypothetical protein
LNEIAFLEDEGLFISTNAGDRLDIRSLWSSQTYMYVYRGLCTVILKIWRYKAIWLARQRIQDSGYAACIVHIWQDCKISGYAVHMYCTYSYTLDKDNEISGCAVHTVCTVLNTIDKDSKISEYAAWTVHNL